MHVYVCVCAVHTYAYGCVNCTVVLKHSLIQIAFTRNGKSALTTELNGDLLIPYGVSNFNFYFKK